MNKKKRQRYWCPQGCGKKVYNVGYNSKSIKLYEYKNGFGDITWKCVTCENCFSREDLQSVGQKVRTSRRKTQ